MQFKNTPQRYGVVSAALHWLTATVVYGMLRWVYGWSRSVITTAGITGRRNYKSIGMLLMMALIVRIIWRLYSPPPVALTSYSV